jgi:hypothetical protein
MSVVACILELSRKKRKRMRPVVMDRHVANLGEQAGMGDEWSELFCDEEFMAMLQTHYNQMVKYIKAKYPNVSGIK